MSKMAPLIGRSSTERLFLDRFAALCTDSVFYVRKVCAANFGEFCAVVGTDATENVLVSILLLLFSIFLPLIATSQHYPIKHLDMTCCIQNIHVCSNSMDKTYKCYKQSIK